MNLRRDLNISNLIKTSVDNSILLLNDEYDKKTSLMIIKDDCWYPLFFIGLYCLREISVKYF